jgi:hypothetical protein
VEAVSGNTFRLNTYNDCKGPGSIAITGNGSGLLGGKLLLLQDGRVWNSPYWNDISYHGKSFGQNYRWGFDYVNWREGRDRNRP